jgi:hypothetical protein
LHIRNDDDAISAITATRFGIATATAATSSVYSIRAIAIRTPRAICTAA